MFAFTPSPVYDLFSTIHSPLAPLAHNASFRPHLGFSSTMKQDEKKLPVFRHVREYPRQLRSRDPQQERDTRRTALLQGTKERRNEKRDQARSEQVALSIFDRR
jgi:hypothetical protein